MILEGFSMSLGPYMGLMKPIIPMVIYHQRVFLKMDISTAFTKSSTETEIWNPKKYEGMDGNTENEKDTI